MSDIYSVLDRMKGKLHTLREETDVRMREFALGLLYDALVFTGPKIRILPSDSLVEFIELTTWTVQTPEPDKEHLRSLRRKLVMLGFRVTPEVN